MELARPELGSGSGKGSPLRVRSQPHRVESPLALGRCLHSTGQTSTRWRGWTGVERATEEEVTSKWSDSVTGSLEFSQLLGFSVILWDRIFIFGKFPKPIKVGEF